MFQIKNIATHDF